MSISLEYMGINSNWNYKLKLKYNSLVRLLYFVPLLTNSSGLNTQKFCFSVLTRQRIKSPNLIPAFIITVGELNLRAMLSDLPNKQESDNFLVILHHSLLIMSTLSHGMNLETYLWGVFKFNSMRWSLFGLERLTRLCCPTTAVVS